MIIKEIFDIDSIWNEALNRDISASGPSKLDLLVDIQRHTSANIEWLLSNHNSLENIEEIAKSYKANIPEITSMLPKHLSIKNKFDILKNSKEILDIIIIKRFSSQNLDTIMDLYYAIGDRMAFSWMKQKLSAITPDDYIDKTALKKKKFIARDRKHTYKSDVTEYHSHISIRKECALYSAICYRNERL